MVTKQLPDASCVIYYYLLVITLGFVVISKHCTFTSTLLQVLKSSFTFYSSTFFTKYFYFDSSSFEVNYFYLSTKLK